MVSVGCVSDADASDRLCGMIPLVAFYHGAFVYHRNEERLFDQVFVRPHDQKSTHREDARSTLPLSQSQRKRGMPLVTGHGA